MLNSIKCKDDITLIILSGREDKSKEHTCSWLKENKINFDNIYMRKTGDFRKDSIIKKEIYDEFIKDKYTVMGVFDDRPQVVRMWKELGLFVFNVYQDPYNIEF
jgi:hypothetical protein